jgi:hypothetical protein
VDFEISVHLYRSNAQWYLDGKLKEKDFKFKSAEWKQKYKFHYKLEQ